MQPGFPPKPTAIKRLEGNPGKRALPTNEPQPTRAARCPADLSPEVRREWRKLAPILNRMGVLFEPDALALANLCRDIVEERNVSATCAKVGLIIQQKGFFSVNPLFHIQSEVRKRISNALREFGMTPSARSRLQVAPDVRLLKERKAAGGVLDGQWKSKEPDAKSEYGKPN